MLKMVYGPSALNAECAIFSLRSDLEALTYVNICAFTTIDYDGNCMQSEYTLKLSNVRRLVKSINSCGCHLEMNIVMSAIFRIE